MASDRKTVPGAPFPRIKPDSPIQPSSSDNNPNPWDIAIGHANVPEDMSSPLGEAAPDPHQGHVDKHSVAAYATYEDEDVRNPADAS